MQRKVKYVFIVCLMGVLFAAACENNAGLPIITEPPAATISLNSASSEETTATFTPFLTATPLLSITAVSPSATAFPITNTPTQTAIPPEPSATESAQTSRPLSTDMIYIDHTAVALFAQIPEEYLLAAADIPMLFIDRSVGVNISEALDCLAFPSNEEAPYFCSVYKHAGTPPFDSDPSEVSWNRPAGYGRDNWVYETWPDNDCGRWQRKTPCFISRATEIIDQYQVLSYQFSYLAVDAGSTIADQPGGFFSDNPDPGDVYDLEAFEAQHPDKTFIYWTTSLARSIGSDVSDSFNNQMRQYTIEHNKVLFDVADILSHDPDGNPCYDNRDGIPYNSQNDSENFPDDGYNYLAICPHYTTETEGGHLGSTSTGAIRIAKAFWVLMARLSGWDGNPQ